MATERLSGMQVDIVRESRKTVLKLRTECKEVVEQCEAGLITYDEMANALIERAMTIRSELVKVGGYVIW